MKTKPSRNRGAALLITLAFIVLISILIVGFAASMRTDRPAANMYLEKTRATLYAQAGVESVIATLRQTTADTNRYWISQPGQIIAGKPADDPTTTMDERKVLSLAVPLHSGAAPSPAPTDPVLQACNLNVTTLRDPTTSLITDRPDVSNPAVHALMQVAWIYVRQDGTRDTSQTPTVSTSNPIIGRFAYWTDDESSKVNYNLAWGRTTTTPPNTNAPGSPTKISLTALTSLTASMGDAIHGYITDTSMGLNYQSLTHGFFNTPEEARQVDQTLPGVSAALTANKFEVTHYSNDPDTTFFNQPRIVLTTQGTRAGATWSGTAWVGGKPFLNLGNITPANLYDPDNLTVANYQATIALLVSYLKRTDWPMVSGTGSSFQQKYYGSYPSNQQFRLTQLAINIIDYVRSKESPTPVVIPSRGIIDPVTGLFTLTSNTTTLGNPANAMYVFLGQTRAPKINEMGVWVNQVTGSTYLYKIKVELYLPPNYGLSQIDLIGGNYGMYIDEFTEVALLPPAYPNPPYDPTGNAAYTFRFADTTLSGSGQMTISNSALLNAGNYVTIGYYPSLTPNSTSLPVGGRMDGLRVSLFQFSGTTTASAHTKVDFAPLLGNYSNTIYFAQDPAGTSEANNTSMEVDDPRINTFGGNSGVGGDWKKSAKNTYDAVNSRSSIGNVASSVTPQPPTGGPQLDTDTNGNISAASLYMPPPAGAKFTRADGSVDDNTLGAVTSVGELGYIDTGMESTAKQGLPWRTLRLQTSALDTTIVPDWALMDLFTVPSTVSTPAAQMATPYGNSYGGRVNLNSQVAPFNMSRTLPLAAVLQGASATTATTVSAASAQTLATNVYNRVLSPLNTSTSAYGKQYGYASAYDSPGEMIEAQGIGDQGEAGEALVRDIANLVTARGNVYSVYTVGQSLKQTPTGTLSITGEQRLQAMVERYLSTSTGTVQFRTVYFRNLTP